MKSRTAKGRTIKTTRSFAVVDEESFNDYDEHRLLYRKENPNSRIVPVCDLLLYWMAEIKRAPNHTIQRKWRKILYPK